MLGIACGYADANDAARIADDPTHGQQELAFYNGHYDSWCSLPMVAMARNKRLGPHGARLLAPACAEAKRTGQSAAFFGETRYAARK